MKLASAAFALALLASPALAADYQISTGDEPTMFAAAQGLQLIPATTIYAPGLVGQLSGGVQANGMAWAANCYGAQSVPTGATTTNAQGQTVPVMQTNPGYFCILRLPDGYALPGDTQTLASRVFITDPTTGITTATPYVYGPVTIQAVPSYSPVVFS